MLIDPAVRAVALVRLRVGLGDLICSAPAWLALRAARPDLRLAYITWAETAPVLARLGVRPDELLAFPGHRGIPERPPIPSGWPAFRSAALDRRFDLAIQAYGDNPAANAVTGRLGACRVGGFAPAGFRPTRDAELHLPYPRERHEIDRHLALVRHLGVPAGSRRPTFAVRDADRRAARALADRHGLAPDGFAVVHPGATSASRRWPVERFAEVADGLADRGLRVTLGGVAGERALTHGVAAAMRAPAVDLAGATPLGVYAALLADAALLVGNDTGTSHLAAAVGAPAVTVFLSGDPARWRHPGHRVARAGVACSPCPHLRCPIGFGCATELPVSAVLAEVDGVLAEADVARRG